MRDYILLYINGQRHEVTGEKAFMPLSDYLRYELCATGTKVVCAEGDCGACTILQGKRKEDSITYKPVNSCIQYIYQLDCSHIITIEGLKDKDESGQERLNPVQEAMVQCHGAQCGYCTPGFVVTMCALSDAKSDNTPFCETELRESLTGNLCRCTGYEPIIKAGLAVALEQSTKLTLRYPSEGLIQAFKESAKDSVQLEGRDVDGEKRLFYVPKSVEEAIALKIKHPQAIVTQGGTDISVACNKRDLSPPVIISLSNWPEALAQLEIKDKQLIIGAKATLMDLERLSKEKIPELYNILQTFGGPQIKYAGTIVGNIANGSPIGDSAPFLMVMDAEIEVQGSQSIRRININDFYLGYKKLALQPDEVITRIYCPLPAANEHLKLYKISRRKHLDISTFTAAIRLQMQGELIEKAYLAYGGVGPVVLRLRQAEAFLQNKPFTLSLFEECGAIAKGEITPLSDVRGSQAYRYQLAENILQKFYYDVQAKQPQSEVFAV